MDHIALADLQRHGGWSWDDHGHDGRGHNGPPHGRQTPDQFYLTCTAGCSYSVGGAVDQGNIQVRQQ
ncbi:MAG: hypothetical protein WBF12_10435, partial [Bradyrhizobium sp.]